MPKILTDGPGRDVSGLVETLKRHGFEPTVIMPPKEPPPAVPEAVFQIRPLPELPDCYAHHRRQDGVVRNPCLKARFKKGSKTR